MAAPDGDRLLFQDPGRVRWGRRLLWGVAVLVGLAVVSALLASSAEGGGAALVAGLSAALAIGFVGPGLVMCFAHRDAWVDTAGQRLVVRWRFLGLGTSRSRALGAGARVVLEPQQVHLETLTRTEYGVRYTIEGDALPVVRTVHLALARQWATSLAERLGVPLVDKSPH